MQEILIKYVPTLEELPVEPKSDRFLFNKIN